MVHAVVSQNLQSPSSRPLIDGCFFNGIDPAEVCLQINYCAVVDDDDKVRWIVIQFEPRMARMERVMDEHTQVIGGLREAVTSLDQRVGRLEDRVDRGFERVDRRFDAMDEKMSRHFRWQLGILLSSLIAMMGTLGGIVAVLIGRA